MCAVSHWVIWPCLTNVFGMEEGFSNIYIGYSSGHTSLKQMISLVKKNIFVQSKQKGNDQELIQSHPTSYPQYQKGKKDTHKI